MTAVGKESGNRREAGNGNCSQGGTVKFWGLYWHIQKLTGWGLLTYALNSDKGLLNVVGA